MDSGPAELQKARENPTQLIGCTWKSSFLKPERFPRDVPEETLVTAACVCAPGHQKPNYS